MFAPGIENQFSGYDLRQNSSPAANRVVARTSRTSRTLSPGGGSNSNHLKQARQSLRHINVNKSYQGGASRKRSAPTTTPVPAPAASSARSHEPTTRSQKKGASIAGAARPKGRRCSNSSNSSISIGSWIRESMQPAG